MNLFVLAIAGAFGTLARYGLGLLIAGWMRGFGSSFPLGTLVINVLGSFVLSYVTTLALNGRLSPDVRLAIGTGFCGAFTTFSTFELEAHGLISQGLNSWGLNSWGLNSQGLNPWGANLEAGLYVIGNLVLGFAAVLLGRWLAGG